MSPRRKPDRIPSQLPTVLIVGRSRSRVTTLERALGRYGIFTTTLAWRSSAAGLWRLGAKTPHVIVVDLPPPITADHVEALQRLRDRWEHAPQVVVTSEANASVLTSLLAVGVDDFVSCDGNWAWGELIVRIRRQLRRAAPAAGPLSVGPDGMRLDAAKRTVSANGQHVTLTTREFEVFRCLVEGGGGTLSREDVLRQVWGDAEDCPPTPGIVGVYVLYLRRKLGKVGLAQALRTVKGKGYSFQAPGRYWDPSAAAGSAPASARARRRSRSRNLHPSPTTGNARAANDDLDVSSETKKDSDKAVRRKAL